MNWKLSAVLALCAGGFSTAHAQLLGVGNFGNAFQTQSLYSINPATGAATLIGNTGLTQVTGIAWDGSRLLAYTAAADVYVVNPSTGASGLLAASNNTQPEGDISYSAGSLYQINSAGQVSTVNLTSAALTPVIDLSSAGSDFSALSVTPTLSAALALNGSNPDGLVIFSSTGIFTTILPGTNGLNVAAMASDGANAWISDGTQLYSLSTSSGGATLIGSFGVTGMSAMAFIPAPGAAAVLGLGLVPVARRRR